MHHRFPPFTRLTLCIVFMLCWTNSFARVNPTRSGYSYFTLLLISSNTVVVSSGRVFDQDEGEKSIHRLRAFRTTDGHPAWDVEVESRAYRGIAGTDGTVILATTHGLLCLRLRDGSSVWTAKLVELTDTKDPELENPVRRAGRPPHPFYRWNVSVSRIMLVDDHVIVGLTMRSGLVDMETIVARSWVVLRSDDGHEFRRGKGQAFAASRKDLYVVDYADGSNHLSTVPIDSDPLAHHGASDAVLLALVRPSCSEIVDVTEGPFRWPAVIQTRDGSFFVGGHEKGTVEVSIRRTVTVGSGGLKYMATTGGLVVYRYAAFTTEVVDKVPSFDVEFVPFDESEGWKVRSHEVGLPAFTPESWGLLPAGFDGSGSAWFLRWNWSVGNTVRADGACLVGISMTDGSVNRVIPITGTVHVYGGAMISPETNSVILVLHETASSSNVLEASYRIVSIPIAEGGASWEIADTDCN